MLTTARVIDNLRRIFLCGVKSVQPVSLFGDLEFTTNFAVVEKDEVISICGERLNIAGKQLHLVGFGKAVLGMAVQLERVLGKRLKSGILSVPVGTGQKFSDVSEMQLCPESVIKVYEGAENNLPDNSAMQTAIKIRNLAESMEKNDILFVLISGGGSALLPLPVHVMALEEKSRIIQSLLSEGASINELNIVRISISQIKGGKLAQLARGAYKIISLVISDIVNNPLDLIASGPTFCRQMTKSAEYILKKYGLWDTLRKDIKLHIQSEADKGFSVKNSSIHLIGSNNVAVAACRKEAEILGYKPFILSTSLTGDVNDITLMYISFLETIQKFQQNGITENELIAKYPFENLSKGQVRQILSRDGGKPLCFILAGEPTVKVNGNGIGGRNQELALRMSLALHENHLLRNVYFLSAGTDGIDGPTPAAGAVGCREVIENFLKNDSLQKARNLLKKNDSYNFYKSIPNDCYHVITGHTGTNVMDLHIIFVLSNNALLNKL